MRRFARVGSTNRWVLDQARAGAAAGLVAVADHQVAGRGRHGRTWESPPGTALLASVLLRPSALAVAQWPLAGVAAALAAADACRAVAGVAVTVKWPNDLVVGDAKLGGVLAEAEPAVGAAVVGLGVNLTWSPPGATRLGPVDRDTLLDAWLAALDAVAADWPAVVSSFRHRCSTLGRAVRVDLPEGSFTGTAVDLTGAGHLVVEAGGVRRTVAAADVVHLREDAGTT